MSLTPDFRKTGNGMASSPSPFYTPRPERRRPESRGSDWNSGRHDHEKEVNVQVLLRCRPLNEDEQKSNVPRVVKCNESKREVTVMQNGASKQLDRVFTFDKVFGPNAHQWSIYDQAVSPIVSQVLEGFNCTVFAYGQTGTGKTYTMEGGMRTKGGELSAEAGVIPRAVKQIFDTLQAQNADYSMKVTFLELYNEELTDLLANEDQQRSFEEKQKKSICLMEDGKGAVVVRGLEEETVYSANEIYSLLERGAARRRTADTLLNKHSSRSHSVFTIMIHIKEGTIGDEELIKCGKLNLVDLAGSENISRSGAREARAREAGEINKSLLTLGRVINSLVEHSIHVPYRDSKLTRLLRDSLGGKTKTCIIATVSPSALCLDETMSTLEYAHRAKSIKNKPEANQKVTKAVLLKDIFMEMERMKQEIRAAREKNGVYIPHERFQQDEAEKKEKTERIEQLESDLKASEKEVDRFRDLYYNEEEEKLNVQSDLKECKKTLQDTCNKLQDVEENYKLALSLLKEKELIISKLQHSESNLIDCAKRMRVNLQEASRDISSLFVKIDRKDKLERENQDIIHAFGANLDKGLKDLNGSILSSISEQEQQLKCIEERMGTFLASKNDSNEAMESKVKKLSELYTSGMIDLKKLTDMLQTKASSDVGEMKAMMSVQATSVEDFLKNASLEAMEVIKDLQSSLDEQQKLLAFSAEQQAEGLSRSLASANVITSAAINFSNDLHRQASELMKLVEESQIEKCRQLQDFEMTFKDEAVREEKLAMQNIAAILSSLTVKKSNMVSKASKGFQDSSIQESKKLLLDLSGMQQVLTTEMNELNQYADGVKDHYVNETFSSAESRTTLENCLQECGRKVELTNRQWQNAQFGTSHLTKEGLSNLESAAKRMILETHSVHENITSTSSSMAAELNTNINDLMMSINDSLVLDKENKIAIDLTTATSFDQLKSIKTNHKERISLICDKSEQCIHRDYLVEQVTNLTPKKREIPIPSMESIEEMKAHVNHSDSTNISRAKVTEIVPRNLDRTPFQDVNGVVV